MICCVNKYKNTPSVGQQVFSLYIDSVCKTFGDSHRIISKLSSRLITDRFQPLFDPQLSRIRVA